MITSQFTTTILRPDEGHYLTEANEVDIKVRSFSTVIALGANDSADNYKEIDEAEYQALKAEQEAALKAKQEAEQEAALKAEQEAKQEANKQ